jgi:hypothetical protein
MEGDRSIYGFGNTADGYPYSAPFCDRISDTGFNQHQDADTHKDHPAYPDAGSNKNTAAQ